MTTLRNRDVETLKTISAVLIERGFSVSAVVVPENFWVDGNPYIVTTATCRDIMDAKRGW